MRTYNDRPDGTECHKISDLHHCRAAASGAVNLCDAARNLRQNAGMSPDSTIRYRFRPTVLVQTDLVPAILLDLGTGHYFEANDSAHELVLAMQRSATLADLAACLQSAYGIDAARAMADAEVTFNEWRQRGWIEPVA